MYKHSGRCTLMLSIRKSSPLFSAIFTTLIVTNWHILYTLLKFSVPHSTPKELSFLSYAAGHITLQFLLPTQLATIVQELAAEEFWKGSNLTSALPSGFEAISYELQTVLEVTILSKGISFPLGVPMNTKSATYNVFQAEPLYQPNDDGKTASVYQFPKGYVAIAADNTNSAELAASTLQQCTKSNRIKLCREGFSTTTDQTLVCLTSFYFSQHIPGLRNCPVFSVFHPEAPQTIYLANGVYHLISCNPTMDIKKHSRTHGLSLSTIDSQACVHRPTCTSTIYINQGRRFRFVSRHGCM